MINDENTPDLEQDANNNQEEQYNQEDNNAQQQDDQKDWQAEALKLQAILDRQKKKMSKPAEKSQKQSNEGLDYGEKAYLAANGIKGKAELEIAERFMRETGKTLEDAIESKYLLAELQELRESQAVSAATPKNGRSNGSAVDTVEYWMNKPIEEVPQNMRIKVVNAKLDKENNSGVFYNS